MVFKFATFDPAQDPDAFNPAFPPPPSPSPSATPCQPCEYTRTFKRSLVSRLVAAGTSLVLRAPVFEFHDDEIRDRSVEIPLQGINFNVRPEYHQRQLQEFTLEELAGATGTLIEVTKMLIKVDLKCWPCYKKMKKILCKFPDIRDQIYDEKNNTVLITVKCHSPEKIRHKIICKGGETVRSVDILPNKPKEPKKKPEKPKELEKKPDKPKEPEKKPEKPVEITSSINLCGREDLHEERAAESIRRKGK